MINRIHRTAIGISAVTALSLSLIATATAVHGPNCDQPREDVIAFLQDNPDEWRVYDRDGDGVACEETHQLTMADITDDEDGDDVDIETPTEIDTGR